MWRRFLIFPLALLVGLIAVGAAIAALVVALAYPNLPSLDALTDYQPKVPLRVYTEDGALIGEFGEERRSVISIDEVPKFLKEAIISAEDERFYQHAGIDYVGVLRAAYSNILAGGKRQGASTITMQVARNFFLSSEKTFTRKLYEALLAFKIEHSLSKEKILELYINQIYLGQRAYGFAAAAQTYFGKSLDQLNLAEAAMLAGLPKAPSSYNPISSMERAKRRQHYVLGRMKDLGYITDAQYAEAMAAPIRTHRQKSEFPVHADYVAEMVRQAIHAEYPDDAYTRGFRVYTTIRKDDQEAAYVALRKGLESYDRRHGYRGPEGFVKLPDSAQDEDYDELLSDYQDSGQLLAAVVLSATPHKVEAVLRNGTTIEISGEGLKFAAQSLRSSASPRERIRRGAVVRVRKMGRKHWEITQLPEVEGGFIAVDPQDGAVRALVGGFDFRRNKYNHVTQAWRQPGSSFKPFIYSAALEKGFTPATVIADEPIVIDSGVTGGQQWEPNNYDGKFEGPMRMRTALAKSKNMVSIRILQAIGTKYAQDYITRFGFEADKHPPYLTMALGAGSVTPWEMARAYSVFANGGYLLQPYFIEKIVDDHGDPVAIAHPQHAGNPSLRVIDPRNAFIMDSMLHDVTQYGTAARARRLGRDDLAGKTGTTNEFVDAWFCGFQPTLAAIAWVGFDQPKTLGRNQTGSAVALPIWMDFMEEALKGVPEMTLTAPPGVVLVETGPDPTIPDDKRVPEYFYQENVPVEPAPAVPAETTEIPQPAPPAVPPSSESSNEAPPDVSTAAPPSSGPIARPLPPTPQPASQ